MLYDLSHQIVDEKDTPALDEKGNPAELKTVLNRALLTDTADNAKSKFERFELYLKIKAAKLTVELTTEEAKLIKDAASVYPTLVMGQVIHWVENKVSTFKDIL